jgi:broad specificity phosphatase PhoE
MERISRMAILIVLAVFALTPQVHAQQVRTIFLVRHADKVSDEYDSLLNDQGHRRAECLANMLADSHIEQIYTSNLQRTQQTAAPLANRLQLKPVAIPADKPGELVDAIRSGNASNVLVVWHGGSLPSVLRALGGPEIATIGNAEYDRFLILTLAANQKHPEVRFTFLRYCDCMN